MLEKPSIREWPMLASLQTPHCAAEFNVMVRWSFTLEETRGRSGCRYDGTSRLLDPQRMTKV